MQAEQARQRQYSTAWILLLALLTALRPLSIDMYLPALPQMADEFGVSMQMIANTLPAYFLGLAIGQLIYGPVSDRIGRKTPLYFGLALYVVASLACVFVSIVVSAGLMNHAPLWLLMSGLFLVVSGIGLTGPNAMALAMSKQGARAGTASAIMGSMQFACGLLGGVILNFLIWKASLNMGLMMLMFTSAGLFAIFKVGKQQDSIFS